VDAVISCRSPCLPEPAAQYATRHYERWADEAALEPKVVAHAHRDLPCGVEDPAQARIEAESIKAIGEKYQQNRDPAFRARCLTIKGQRSELVKHHLWALWTDYFKPPHFEKYP
jgi:nickel superoxide dismutase